MFQKAVETVYLIALKGYKNQISFASKINLTLKNFVLRIKYPPYLVRNMARKERYMKNSKNMVRKLKVKGNIFASLPPVCRKAQKAKLI